MSLQLNDPVSRPAAAADPRQRILEAAMRCFAESGFHGASMQEICAAASMSPGGVYRYFASKDAIIVAIAGHVHDSNAAYFEQMTAQGATLHSFLEVGFACLKDLTQGPASGLFCEVFAEAQRHPQIRVAFEDKCRQVRAMMRDVLARMQAEGAIEHTLDVDVVAIMLMAIGDGLLVRTRLDPDVTFEALWPGLKDLVLRMLRPIPADSAEVGVRSHD